MGNEVDMTPEQTMGNEVDVTPERTCSCQRTQQEKKKVVARLRPRSLSPRARATVTILVPKTN